MQQLDIFQDSLTSNKSVRSRSKPNQLQDFSIDSQQQEAQKTLLKLESSYWNSGFERIAGIDEAGRGPLAGPVVACCCILPKGELFYNVRDSKTVTATDRKELYLQLTSNPQVHWACSIVDSPVIDEINILQATLLAMKQALELVSVKPDFVLVDGLNCPQSSIPSKAIVKGDSLSQTIAAASIIAKVTRDEIMDTYHQQFPQYGFDKHKGYGTKAHLQAIEKFGPCPIHRLSFRPIKRD